MNKWLALLVLPLPSKLKNFILRFLGHNIHKSAYIGFSYLNIDRIELAQDTYIGHGNVFFRLGSLQLDQGSRISRWNQFSSGAIYQGKIILKKNASISLRHYFDVCDLIEIGENTIVAGHRSTFFTHSKGIEKIDYTKQIVIGNFCYLGSNLKVLPGVVIADHCFVGMGSVLVGNLSESPFFLFAGNPAKPIKKLPETAAYFQQGNIIHSHVK